MPCIFLINFLHQLGALGIEQWRDAVQELKLCAMHYPNIRFSRSLIWPFLPPISTTEAPGYSPCAFPTDFESHNVSLNSDFRIQVQLGFYFPHFFFSSAVLIFSSLIEPILQFSYILNHTMSPLGFCILCLYSELFCRLFGYYEL